MSPHPHIAVIGNGVVGQRLVQRLELAGPSRRTVLIDTRVVDVGTTRLLDDVGVAVLTIPGDHHDVAVELINRSIHVVSIGDDVDDVAAMITESDRAQHNGVSLVIGAGMSPGLSGLVSPHNWPRLTKSIWLCTERPGQHAHGSTTEFYQGPQSHSMTASS
jgi:saccharopine dehydrogenase-like NADP-dependent oxidoreductase